MQCIDAYIVGPPFERGDPCELRATWAGEPPDVGDYLSSGERARFAYAILGVAQLAPGKLKLEVIRLAPADVPPITAPPRPC